MIYTKVQCANYNGQLIINNRTHIYTVSDLPVTRKHGLKQIMNTTLYTFAIVHSKYIEKTICMGRM